MIRVQRQRPRRRRGMLMAFALICLALVIVVLGAMLQRVALIQRQCVTRERQIQSQLIAASALDLAKSRVAADGSYTGETWRVGSPALTQPGLAEIEVNDGMEIQVVALFPDRHLAVRTERQIRIVSEAKP